MQNDFSKNAAKMEEKEKKIIYRHKLRIFTCIHEPSPFITHTRMHFDVYGTEKCRFKWTEQLLLLLYVEAMSERERANLPKAQCLYYKPHVYIFYTYSIRIDRRACAKDRNSKQNTSRPTTIPTATAVWIHSKAATTARKTTQQHNICSTHRAHYTSTAQSSAQQKQRETQHIQQMRTKRSIT